MHRKQPIHSNNRNNIYGSFGNRFFYTIMTRQGILDKLSQQINPNNLKLDKRLVVFLVFVGIATLLWFLAALEKNHITSIEHPVVFNDLPNNKVLVNELPSKLTLEVEGKGFTILRHNWDISKSPVVIKFTQLSQGISQKKGILRLDIPTSQIKSRISNQLDNLKVLSITPDSLHFVLAGTSTKKVPVISNLSFDLQKQYMIRDKIKISPDSITVTGPALIIDTLSGIYTTSLRLRNLNRSASRTLNLENPNTQLKLETDKVEIEIPVEQFTEKKLTIPIDPINLPDSLNLKTFPATVEATFRVVMSAYDKIQPEDFRIVVDYLDIESGTSSKIKAKILLAPSLIENPRIKPEIMDYLLEQK